MSLNAFVMCEVPTGFEFILYMYGPFSFDLSDELTSIRADGLLKIAVIVQQIYYRYHAGHTTDARFADLG